jgi:hypothetical protein
MCISLSLCIHLLFISSVSSPTQSPPYHCHCQSITHLWNIYSVHKQPFIMSISALRKLLSSSSSCSSHAAISKYPKTDLSRSVSTITGVLPYRRSFPLHILLQSATQTTHRHIHLLCHHSHVPLLLPLALLHLSPLLFLILLCGLNSLSAPSTSWNPVPSNTSRFN